MKELSIFRKSILGVSAGVAAGALMFAPLPAEAGKDRLEPGRTLSGNYLAGRHAQARKDLSAASRRCKNVSFSDWRGCAMQW